MKIALVYDLIYPYSIGGVETRTHSLAKELVLKGHEVHLFGVKMWKGESTLKVTEGFFIHGVSRYSRKYKPTGKRSIIDPIRYSIALFFELMKHDFDIVDCSSFPYFPAFSCLKYGLLKRKKVVITWHEVWDDYWQTYSPGPVGFIGRLIEHALIWLSKHNISVSERTSGRLKKLGGKSHLIENWIDSSALEPYAEKKADKKYDLICVCRHLKHKNIDLLLRTLAILKGQGKNVKTLILGEGPETLHLLKLKASLKLDNVDMLSFTKEKKTFYNYLAQSKVFILLSELEGFSITSFEAMALGLPVITIKAKMNGLQDYIKDGHNGYACEKNAAIIATTISSLLGDKKKLARMSDHAAEYSKEFEEKKSVGRIIVYYEEVIGKKHNNKVKEES